jgi:hypothetical protein
MFAKTKKTKVSPAPNPEHSASIKKSPVHNKTTLHRLSHSKNKPYPESRPPLQLSPTMIPSHQQLEHHKMTNLLATLRKRIKSHKLSSENYHPQIFLTTKVTLQGTHEPVTQVPEKPRTTHIRECTGKTST